MNKQFPTELKWCNYFGEKILRLLGVEIKDFGGKENMMLNIHKIK